MLTHIVEGQLGIQELEKMNTTQQRMIKISPACLKKSVGWLVTISVILYFCLILLSHCWVTVTSWTDQMLTFVGCLQDMDMEVDFSSTWKFNLLPI